MTPSSPATAPAITTGPAAPGARPGGAALLRIAVVGAGPVGLALALQAWRRWPAAQLTVYDAQPAERDLSQDPRTLALSLGSVHELQRLGVWPAIAPAAAPITLVHVTQQQPAWPLVGGAVGGAIGGGAFGGAIGGAVGGLLGGLFAAEGEPTLELHAHELGEAMLGAVASYGAIVTPLRAAFLSACSAEAARATCDAATERAAEVARTPAMTAPAGAVHTANAGAAAAPAADAVEPPAARLVARLGTAITQIDTAAGLGQVRLTRADGAVDEHDLVVIAEGGIFAQQTPKAVVRDYGQTAWIGTVEIEGGDPGAAFERFTPHGPAALLPLPRRADLAPGRSEAALVWCADPRDPPADGLDAAGCAQVLGHIFPARVGRIVQVSPLKSFALGLNAEARLVRGASVRIGNAAQTLHPVAGQGLNLGLRDVAVLVEHLHACRSVEDLRRRLPTLELSRAPDRWALIGATDLLARAFTWNLPGLAAARGLGLGLLQRLPFARQELARRMMFGVR